MCDLLAAGAFPSQPRHLPIAITQVDGDPMVILVAEDHEDVRLAIWNILKAEGFTVLAAYDGISTLELSRCYPGTIDLLLSDMDMPRMGGLELCKTIAAERPGIKVLMMSGEASCKEQVSMNGLPFLQKPFTHTVVRDSIEALLGPIQPSNDSD